MRSASSGSGRWSVRVSFGDAVIQMSTSSCVVRTTGMTTPLCSTRLNLINPYAGEARLPEPKRYGGFRRNVNHSATGPGQRSYDDATAVVEVDDADLRPQTTMRRNQSSEPRVLKIWYRQVGDFSPIGRYLRTMNTTSKSIYRGHRFPAEVIEQAVWLYFRFPLSLRMVEDLLAARGIIVSHETVRCWAEKFGRIYANKIRRRAPRFGDKWHLDEGVPRRHQQQWRCGAA